MAMLGLEFSLRKIIAGFIIAVLVAFFFGFIAGYNATKDRKLTSDDRSVNYRVLRKS